MNEKYYETLKRMESLKTINYSKPVNQKDEMLFNMNEKEQNELAFFIFLILIGLGICFFLSKNWIIIWW